jgi:ComF family protein
VPLQRCAFCRALSPRGETCARCRRRRALDSLVVRGVYRDWVWRDIIRTWKYAGAADLGLPASRYLAACRPLLTPEDERTLVVPVPLTRRRERERGFNQAAVLAEAVAGLGSVTANALQRVRETRPQAKLTPIERQENVRDAFRASAAVNGRPCLLVDDIATTGATLDAAARALKAAGAPAVRAVALVRSDPQDR